MLGWLIIYFMKTIGLMNVSDRTGLSYPSLLNEGPNTPHLKTLVLTTFPRFPPKPLLPTALCSKFFIQSTKLILQSFRGLFWFRRWSPNALTWPTAHGQAASASKPSSPTLRPSAVPDKCQELRKHLFEEKRTWKTHTTHSKACFSFTCISVLYCFLGMITSGFYHRSEAQKSEIKVLAEPSSL